MLRHSLQGLHFKAQTERIHPLTSSVVSAPSLCPGTTPGIVLALLKVRDKCPNVPHLRITAQNRSGISFLEVSLFLFLLLQVPFLQSPIQGSFLLRSFSYIQSPVNVSST